MAPIGHKRGGRHLCTWAIRVVLLAAGLSAILVVSSLKSLPGLAGDPGAVILESPTAGAGAGAGPSAAPVGSAGSGAAAAAGSSEAYKGVAWGPSDVVLVPAVYNRWGMKGPRGEWFPERPPWAYDAQRHKVFMYQRLWENETRFVPNRGFEGAIYLRFIVDHYDRLPAVMIFMQDDYKWRGFEDCVRPDLSYVNLVVPYKLRNASFFTKAGTAVWEQCLRDFAEIFNLSSFFPERVEPLLGVHPLNNFAVGRKNVRRRPLRVWKRAYEKSIALLCHDGPVEVSRLSKEVLSKDRMWRRGQVPSETANKQKDTGGMILEYIEHMVYDFEAPQTRRYWHGGWDDPVFARDPCDYFLPRALCPESLC